MRNQVPGALRANYVGSSNGLTTYKHKLTLLNRQ